MSFKIAIHHRPHSFSERWIEYSQEQDIQHKVVNCFEQDIIFQLAQCDGLLWHWAHFNPQDVILAQGLIQALEIMGLQVFPNIKTCWHFDNKLGQKYLFEAINAPLIPTYIFYNKQDALKWVDETTFPKIFKLSRGSSSKNVEIVKSRDEAKKLIKRAFGRGFNPVNDPLDYFKGGASNAMRAFKNRNVLNVLKRMPYALSEKYQKKLYFNGENGYVYFQDFIKDNAFDIRVTVIGNRAFAFTRNVRKNDFRASGSGNIDYNLERIDMRCIQLAFKLAKEIDAQSIAFDFLLDASGKPRISEISYAYQDLAVFKCPGHWDENLTWNDGHLWPQDAILSDFVNAIKRKKSNT
ncbi:MAG: hypothetical protein WCQ99_08970 [Pseudomonadota bacterium]